MSDVAAWWLFLCTVSVLNVLAWSASAVAVGRRTPDAHGALSGGLPRLQLLLSAGYVFGCAFRSLFPVFDVQRMCVVDSWLSSVLVGRSVATVAELCFVAQWALLLRHVARSMASRSGEAVSFALLPLIAVAELCSWHAVLTTSNLGHVFEESIWAASVALLVGVLLVTRRRWDAGLRSWLAVCTLGGIGYVAYMACVDVPMYWSRWVADQAAGHGGLSLAQGVLDAARHCAVSDRWHDWRSEVPWMTPYFSVAVWLSIALVHVRLPLPRRSAAPAGARPPRG